MKETLSFIKDTVNYPIILHMCSPKTSNNSLSTELQYCKVDLNRLETNLYLI